MESELTIDDPLAGWRPAVGEPCAAAHTSHRPQVSSIRTARFFARNSVVWAATLFVAAVSGAAAEDVHGPAPEESIAQILPGYGVPGGLRAALAGGGISYGANYIGEFFDVASGGLSRGTSYDGRVEAFADIDLEKLAGWKGGTFHVNGYYIHGVGPQAKHLGSIAPVSSIEALESLRLFEIWVEQSFLDDKLKIRAGQLAADNEFLLSDTAGKFLNGTFGWPGIVAANMLQGGPAYPFAAPGVRLQLAPTDAVTVLAAVYDSLPADPNAPDPQRDNRHGTNFRVEDPPLVMVEGQFKYDFGLPGLLKLGGWKEFNDFADQQTGALIDGDHGLYAIVDQQIWKGEGDQGVSVFGRISRSPGKQNTIDFYVDTGIVFSGLVTGRPKDSFGAAFGYAKISDRAVAADRDAGLPVIRNHEAVLEVNYLAHIAPGWTVVPDFQYFWHPGGRVEDPIRPGEAVKDAAVVGIRTSISY